MIDVLQPLDYKYMEEKWKWENSGISDLSSISVESFTQDSQNTNEAGVFISQNALELAGKNIQPDKTWSNPKVVNLAERQYSVRTKNTLS